MKDQDNIQQFCEEGNSLVLTFMNSFIFIIYYSLSLVPLYPSSPSRLGIRRSILEGGDNLETRTIHNFQDVRIFVK